MVRRFLDEMRERLKKFALTLHPEKTRLIEFGRFAAGPLKPIRVRKSPGPSEGRGLEYPCAEAHRESLRSHERPPYGLRRLECIFLGKPDQHSARPALAL